MIAFGPATEWDPPVDDAEFFRLIKWDRAAPKPLRQLAKSGDWQRAIRVLTKGITGSKSSVPRSDGPTRKLALWSLHDFRRPQRLSRLLAAWQAFVPDGPVPRRTSAGSNGRQATVASKHSKGAKSAGLIAATEEWLAAITDRQPILPLELLVLFEILHEAASGFPVDLAVRLWRTTLGIAVGQFSGTVERAVETLSRTPGHDLGQTALHAELKWQAGLLFAPVAGSSALREAGRAALWSLIAHSSDAAGVPAAHTLGSLPIWMTSVIRSREWGNRIGQPLFSASQERRFRGMVNSIAKFCHEHGRLSLASSPTNGSGSVWSAAAASFPPHLFKASPAARYLLSVGGGKNGAPPRRNRTERNGSRRNGAAKDKTARPVFQSDESRLACLRSDWTPTASSVLVTHQGSAPALEMALGGTTLFTGNWGLDLRIDGRLVELPEWTCVCWHSDEDGDYLELQTRPSGVRVERQVFLSRTDDFALLADIVSSEGHAKIESTSRLPLSADSAAFAQSRSRECHLLCGSTRVRALPLALNCSRVEAATGQLGPAEGHLELTQAGIGGLYAPLVLDWNPRRRRSPISWRSLTVARDGVVVRPNAAAGFLLEIGPMKWLIYRSLVPTLEPRSVLGQHTMYETLMGRFVRGELEPMIQVEQTTESSE